MAPDPTTIDRGIARAAFPWLAGAFLVAGCGGPKDGGDRKTATNGKWNTSEWAATRGGHELQGRVRDPVPRNPLVEWTFAAKGAISTEAAMARGLIVFGDDEGVVYAVDLETRKERWRFETKDTIEATPAVVSDRVFVGSNDGFFRALDLATGNEIWHVKGGDKFPTGGVPVAGPDGTAESILVNGYDGVSRRLRVGDGSEIWKHETEDYINGSPALMEGGVLAFGGCDSVIHLVRLSDGAGLNQLQTDAQIIRSMAAWGGTVYGVNYANQLVAADATGDRLAWTYENDGEQFLTSPGLDEARVYVGSRDKHLHAVDRLTGKPVWKFKTGGRVESAPLVFDDAVVFGSSDGRLYAASKTDGHEIWHLDLGEDIATAPAFAAGRIVVGGGDGTLFVIGEGPAK